MRQDIKENIGNYNKLNGCVNRHFGESMRQDIRQRQHNLISKPVLKYAGETWAVISRDKQGLEAAPMTCMRSLHGVTKRD
jgi:hypothetical protein